MRIVKKHHYEVKVYASAVETRRTIGWTKAALTQAKDAYALVARYREVLSEHWRMRWPQGFVKVVIALRFP